MDFDHHILASKTNLKPENSHCIFQCDPLKNPFGICKSPCYSKCPAVCKTLIVGTLTPFLLSPPPPVLLLRPPTQPPLLHYGNKNQKVVSTGAITTIACIFGVMLLLGIIYIVLRNQDTRRSRSRRGTSGPIIFGTQEDFDRVTQPEIDHPIWYINTIGLEQSLIESITMFKYRKDEGIVQDTDCSVCLNEFEEDECLRLLPKCNHAFHVACIDTWLRSHKNCPLCRAPIVCSNSGDRQVGVVEIAVTDSGSSEGSMIDNDNSEGTSESVCDSVGEIGTTTVNERKDAVDHSTLTNPSRVRSDLVGNRQAVEVEMQPLRRSASVGSCFAIGLREGMENSDPGRRGRGSSEIGLQEMKCLKLKSIVKRGSKRSMSFNKMMMRSAFSIGGVSTKRHSKSLESILPL